MKEGGNLNPRPRSLQHGRKSQRRNVDGWQDSGIISSRSKYSCSVDFLKAKIMQPFELQI